MAKKKSTKEEDPILEEQDVMIPVPMQMYQAFVAASILAKEMLEYGLAGRAINDWEVKAAAVRLGILHPAAAEEPHVEAGIAEKIGDPIFIMQPDFQEIMIGIDRPATAEPELEQAEEVV